MLFTKDELIMLKDLVDTEIDELEAMNAKNDENVDESIDKLEVISEKLEYCCTNCGHKVKRINTCP